MLSSCRKFQACLFLSGQILGATVIALCSQGVLAAETYFEPMVSALVDYNTNRNLEVDEALEDPIVSYRGILQGTWGYTTETGGTIIRPRVDILRYQDRDDLDRTEEYIDLRSTRSTQKSDFKLIGRYSRRDIFNSDLAEAEFNELDPDDPSIPESGGAIAAGTSRAHFQVRPEYSYRISQRTGIGARLIAEATRFDVEIPNQHVDFDFLLAGITMSRVLSPRTRFALVPYVSQFETRDDINRNDSVGIDASWNRALSENLDLRLSLTVEHSEVEIRDEITGEVTQEANSTDYGPAILITREDEVGSLRFSIGRFFTPTNRGGKSVVDQLRLQYNRNIGERLSMTVAVRGFRSRIQGDILGVGGTDYDYARGEVGLRWALTRTWFLAGGYNYTWRDLELEQGSAVNNAVFIAFGYRGRGSRT